MSSLAQVGLVRVHHQDTDVRTSLGTKTGFKWDVWVRCYPPGNVAGGHPTGQPGWQTMVSQPQPQPLDFLVLTDPTGSGRFTPEQGHSNRGLVFEKPDGQGGWLVTALPSEATRARLELWEGGVMEFEVYRETDQQQPLGRLTRLVDRNGNATVVTWKYAVDDPTLTGSLRTKLAIRDRITDPHGRSLVFTYDLTRQYSGVWACTRIDLPDGQHITYRYGQQPTSWLPGQEWRLVGVDHPDGSTSSFDAVSDPAVPGMRWTVSDPVAAAGSRFKTVWFSQDPWINPANAADQRNQMHGRVIRRADGVGDITFLAWYGDVVVNGVTESRTYRWVDGVLSAFAHDEGYKPRGMYVWEGPAGAQLITPDWIGWRKVHENTYASGAQPSGDSTPEGWTVTYVRDPVSQRVTRATYQDGTVACWQRNALGQVTLHRDRLGRLTETAYDAVGNRTAETTGWIAANPDDLTQRTVPGVLVSRSWEYWTAADAGQTGAGLPGQLKAAIDGNGNRTDYTYTASGDLLSIVQPLDGQITGETRAADLREYDVAGRLRKRWDERNVLTRFDYDNRGRLVTTTFADGSTETSSHATSGAAAGLRIASKDRNGNTEAYSWDAAGRRIGIVRYAAPVAPATVGAEVERQAWTYVTGTQQPATYLHDGELAVYGYDGEMRMLTTARYASAAAPLIETMLYQGDRRIGTSDPYGRRTLWVRDVEERVVRTIRERVAGGVPAGADLAVLPRLSGANPSYVVEDVSYDAEGQVLSRTDANGVRSEMDYDAHGRLIALREAVGTTVAATTAYLYDGAGNRTGIRSPRQDPATGLPITTTMVYTGRNLLRSVTEAAGTADECLVRSMRYNPTRQVTWEWDANQAGKAENDPTRVGTQYVYGGCCGRLQSVIDTGGFATTFAYDYNGNRTLTTDPNSLSTVVGYDGRNRMQSTIVNAGQETWTTTYDEHLLDGNGIEDGDATVQAVVATLGFAADICDGSAVRMTDPQGHRTVEIRDGLGRTVARIDALDHVSRTVYDQVRADLTVAQTTTDGADEVRRTDSDGLGRVVRAVDAVGETVMGYDAVGNQLYQHALAGGETVGWSASYDARQRMLTRSETRQGAGTTQWTYDAVGNRLSETAPDQDVPQQRAETYAYDLRNRRLRIEDRLGGITRFAYDNIGNLLRITDAQDGQTTYVYDERHLLRQETFPPPTGGTRTYTYDAGRRLVSRTQQAETAGAQP